MYKAVTWSDGNDELTLLGYLKVEHYKVRICPQLSYSLGVTHLTKSEARIIMKPVERTLKKANFLSQIFLNAILRLPEVFREYGVNNLYFLWFLIKGGR